MPWRYFRQLVGMSFGTKLKMILHLKITIMIKYFESPSHDKLDLFVNNWIDDYTNDKRKIKIISFQVMPVNMLRSSRIVNGGPPEVETLWCAWLCYTPVYT